MIQLRQGHFEPIGLDIGHDSIRMVQLRAIGPVLQIVAQSHEHLVDSPCDNAQRFDTAIEVVQRLLRVEKFSGRRVVTDLVRSDVDAYAAAHTTPLPGWWEAIDAEAAEALPYPSMLSGQPQSLIVVSACYQRVGPPGLEPGTKGL